MRKNAIVTGLDIGSSKVSAVLAEVNRSGVFTVLAHATLPSRGVSKSAVVNISEAVSSISGVLAKLRERSSKAPGDIYVNISGGTISGAKSAGMIPLSLRGREVTNADMERCADAAGTVHLPFDREIIHRIVQRYSVDDQPWIKNPLGLYAARLGCEVYIITADSNHIQNLYKSVNNTGYDIKQLVFTGVADSAAVLDKQNREENVILLDVGSALSEVCVFLGGVLTDMEIIPIGTDIIKSDFKDNVEMHNLLSRINSKKQALSDSGYKIDRIVLTGGIAFTDDIVEFMEMKLSCPVNIGVAKDVKGDISGADSMRLTTAIGLVKYASEKHKEVEHKHKNAAKLVADTVVDIFNNYF